jgi:Putative AphA-like transcriptional regulator
MYRDRSLIPTEAVRLAALGTLALAPPPPRYGELAGEVRQFTARIVGPSLDLVGTPLELLRVEGLIEAVAGEGAAEDALMRITDTGRTELHALLSAALRPPVNDLNKLALALKLRFLHLLPAPERRRQAEAMVEMEEQELARLDDLARRHAAEPGLLPRWLAHEIGQVEARLIWFRGLLDQLAAETR